MHSVTASDRWAPEVISYRQKSNSCNVLIIPVALQAELYNKLFRKLYTYIFTFNPSSLTRLTACYVAG